MKAILALYKAQAKEFLRDRASVFFVLLLPVAFGVFFGLVFSDDGGFVLQLGLVNEDRGRVAERIAGHLQNPEVSRGIEVKIGSRHDLLAALDHGDLHAVLLFPEDLSAAFAADQAAQVEVFYDSARPTSADLGLGIVRSLIDEVNLSWSASTRQLQVEPRPVRTNPLRSIDYYMPGMLGVALLWLGVFGTAQPFVAQREAKVHRRFSVTAITPAIMLGAEVSWRVTVGLIQTALFLVVGYFGFGVGVQAWLPFLAAVLLGTLVFVSLGYVLAGVGRTMESSMAIAQIVNFPMMMLSGSIFSAEMLPAFFRPLADLLPLTYLSDLLRQSMVGASAMHPLWKDFGILGLWLTVLALLAMRLWRWE